MDKSYLKEHIKDFQTCIHVYDILRGVRPEWGTQILKHCMELVTPPLRTDKVIECNKKETH